MKCAVFPCVGLGDALIAAVLSNNLARAGHEVDTFHALMPQMQPLFPYLPFLHKPEDMAFLHDYDRLFFIYETKEWMLRRIDYALAHFPEKTTVLNPIATPNRDYRFWEQGRFDGTRPFVDNLVDYCGWNLGIEEPVRDNGIVLPAAIERGKYPRRVILHPTSSRVGKNWTPKQFLALCRKLEKGGFEPVFILTAEEKGDWPSVEAPGFKDLTEVARFVAESGAMIGNDSGIGHLASCVGVPTLTVCRSKMVADFWRPSWAKGRVIVPPGWIPNLKGLRWRDKKWQHFVPVNRVFKEFLEFRRG